MTSMPPQRGQASRCPHRRSVPLHVLLVTYVLLGWAEVGYSLDPSGCYIRPTCISNPMFGDVFTTTINIPEPCIFHEVEGSQSCELHSSLVVTHKRALPHSQLWMHCEYCGLKGREVAIYKSDSEYSEIDLSWSQWTDFFHYHANDRFKGKVYPEGIVNDVAGIASRPVYILPMITFHVGHMLVDVLEQVYRSMMDTYGGLRRDALIVLDVANTDERLVLQEAILNQVYLTDSAFILMGLLTELPVMSFLTFDEYLAGRHVVFQNLHIGLDISKTHFNIGYKYHPFYVHICHNRELIGVSESYRNFQRDFNQLIKEHVPVVCGERHDGRVSVLIVQRSKNRVLLNEEEVRSSLLHRYDDIAVRMARLETLTFSQQYSLFQCVDILVLVAGTGVHNLLLVTQRPAAVILIMQRGWCDWSWVYANQGLLLGVPVYIYCDGHGEPQGGGISGTTLAFSRSSYLEGPYFWKMSNITVVIEDFNDLFDSALAFVSDRKSADDPSGPTPMACDDVSKNMGYFTHGSAPRASLSKSVSGSRVDSEGEAGRDMMLFVADVVKSQTPNMLGLWDFRVVFEIGLSALFTDYKEYIFSGYPYLSVCILLLGPQDIEDMAYGTLNIRDMNSTCVEMHRFNDYSTVDFSADSLPLLLYGWLQISPSGGRIRSSEVYVNLETRLPYDAGFKLLHCMVASCRDALIRPDGSSKVIPFSVDYRQLSGYFQSLKSEVNDDASETFEYNPIGTISKNPGIPVHRVLQSAIFEFCKKRKWSASICAAFCEAVRVPMVKHFLFQELSLPPPQLLPHRAHPFVFIHVEKCAGSSMRQYLEDSALRLGLSYYIPCHGPVHCNSFHLSENCPLLVDGQLIDQCPEGVDISNISIIAGHFSWNAWLNLPQYLISPASSPPACAVMGRHPVTRVVSYYYQRCYGATSCFGYKRRFNDLSDDELSQLLVSMRGVLSLNGEKLFVMDEGLVDATCRAMSGTKFSTGYIVDGTSPILPSPPPLTAEDMARARSNTNKCVVGIFEDWTSSMMVFHSWFPWLHIPSNGPKKMKLFDNLEDLDTVRPSLRRIVEAANRCDMMLYEHMVNTFKRELESLDLLSENRSD